MKAGRGRSAATGTPQLGTPQLDTPPRKRRMPPLGALKKRARRPINRIVTGSSFRFRLERVRVLRERRENLAKQELARAMTQLSSSEEHLRVVDLRLKQAHSNQRTAAGEPVTVGADELVARQAFLESVEAQHSNGLHELERHESEVADRDAELGYATREHKMLERLKERHRIAHDLESARRESDILNEIALEGFRRSAT